MNQVETELPQSCLLDHARREDDPSLAKFGAEGDGERRVVLQIELFGLPSYGGRVRDNADARAPFEGIVELGRRRHVLLMFALEVLVGRLG